MNKDTQEIAWRYDRQMRFEPVGKKGQQRIGASSVLLVGCGALGSVIADQLVRAGVGKITLVDRDLIEIHNLQRQPLFTEQDIEEGVPKAEAAARHLRAVNSEVTVESHVSDFNFSNCRRFASNSSLIIDGTDNFETRQLINDLALELSVPWIYGGAVSADGIVKAVIPRETSCFRCLMADLPSPGDTPTCETAGIIAPASAIVASIQVSLALQLLSGNSINGDLYIIDAWNLSMRNLSVPRLVDCPACVSGDRSFLEGSVSGMATALCGRDTVQVMPTVETRLDLGAMEEKLAGLGSLENRKFYLSFDDGTLQASIFTDGRCLVKGTDDPARAKAFVAKYVGG